MELMRSIECFLKAMLPDVAALSAASLPPFRLGVFDEDGRLLCQTFREEREPSHVPAKEAQVRPCDGASASGPDMRDFPEASDEARLFPPEALRFAVSASSNGPNAEYSGRAADGRFWISLAAPLPGKRRGTLMLSALRPDAAPAAALSLAFLARGLKQHFALRDTLEETRFKAQFDERIIRSLSSGFLVLLPDTSIRHINPAGARILGGTVDDFIGRRLDSILTSKLRVMEVIRTGEPIIDREMIIRIGDRSIHIVKTAVAVFDDDGRVMAVMDLFQEIKAVRRLVNRMAGSQVRYTFDDIVHRSPVMAETVVMGRTAAASSLSVLITGESGTGKELFAQAIHAASSRRNAPFVVIDCASMPRDLVEGELFGYMEGAFTGAHKGGRPGKFELADGGTVFLDEIGELPLELQSRFLRVLQSRQVMRLGGSHPVPVDIRVIAATNRNLPEQIRTKSFRDDLYYRLNVLSLHIPPLHSRPEDILLLAEHFLRKYQVKMNRQSLDFTPQALDELLRHPWPGNVRELENAVARAVQICGDTVRPEDLRPERDLREAPLPAFPDIPRDRQPEPSPLPAVFSPPPADGPAGLRALQAEFYRAALQRHGGNIAATARFLGVARSTVYKTMRRLDLAPDAARNGRN